MRMIEGALAAAPLTLLISALLMGPAAVLGQPGWPQGWIVVGVFAAIYFTGSGWLAVRRPRSFKVRRQGIVADREKKQPLIDAVGSIAFFAYLTAWFAFIPLDVFLLKLAPEPAWPLRAIGLAGSVAGLLITQLAIAQNEFAAPTVQAQARQQVVDTGLYGVIRHPLYAGNLLTYSGMALWLGSLAALAGVVVVFLFTVARIWVEEAYLRANLPGYPDYAARVRSRLIPFVL
ncbi:methyltransferase family protein [Phenylobacterium terrae]|uniref:Methyltransferase family protein n=1 Tax=Phenylobacterium terrae TaxID=2665495 RepID=A0ABW4MVL2_9CAUL